MNKIISEIIIGTKTSLLINIKLNITRCLLLFDFDCHHFLVRPASSFPLPVSCTCFCSHNIFYTCTGSIKINILLKAIKQDQGGTNITKGFLPADPPISAAWSELKSMWGNINYTWNDVKEQTVYHYGYTLTGNS